MSLFIGCMAFYTLHDVTGTFDKWDNFCSNQALVLFLYLQTIALHV